MISGDSNASADPVFLQEDDSSLRRDPLYIVLPITVIYAVIFFTGVVGNVSTCVVIARNKSMHTATNYYLFSLAVSDLLLLISGLPPEMYYIWSNFPYVFGEAFCIIQSFAAETSANATVLTITAFTVERYVAICHPIISHTMSKLSRAVKFVIVIWVLALCLAVPQAYTFGIVYQYDNDSPILDTARCSTKWTLIEHAFQISTILFFVVPMTIITVLYILIAIQLRKSRLLTAATVKRNHLPAGLNHCDSGRGKSNAQRNVIRMLVAVVVAFFICWAPFHAQRLLAVYAQSSETESQHVLVIVYTILTYMSGVFYYLSTTVNPLLYNIMSNKFREAFKSMLSNNCGWSTRKSVPRQPTYSSLSKYPRIVTRQADGRQCSSSISFSDDNHKSSNATRTMSTELNGLPERKHRSMVNRMNSQDYERSISRGSSASQVTLMTTISNGFNEGNNNVTAACANDCLLKSQSPAKGVTLGVLAERLRLGTKGLFQPQQKVTGNSLTKPKTASALPPRFQSHPSIESTNTISNSSLQDLDETEYAGTELAQYMNKLNCDLIT
ncbi:pyrokinin-1 receptor-like isoform X1 [Hylaeus anthracinus]|uniref:pyrokinin-1 receptor-like isoform X1 n=1 Tax=Hylaeus anthracinus TaxID=313031 RepID=UPI0023B90853|nr:pyrokinin-1 receptor-like isoform X1 [Hylaeus anthracinus]